MDMDKAVDQGAVGQDAFSQAAAELSALAESGSEQVIEFVFEFGAHMAGAAAIAMAHIGDELGLYRAMVGAGPMTAATLAEKTGCNTRLVTEWLRQQAAIGYIKFSERGDDHLFELADEAAVVLASEGIDVSEGAGFGFLAGYTGMFRAMFSDMGEIIDAFRGDGGMSWGDHHHCLFTSIARTLRPQYEGYLVDEWIPAADGMEAKLRSGGTAADVGCGCGDAVKILASAYPESHVTGIDLHAGSIEQARELAAEAGLGNTSFEVADSKSYRGPYDTIFFFDSLHDMGDPVGIAAHARTQLADGGSVLVVEPFALDDLSRNLTENIIAPMAYAFSTVFCTPSSLSQPVGLGLGSQSGEAAMRDVFTEAGYTRFEKIAETMANIVYHASP